MECRDARNLLHPFVDGELDLVRHLQIEHHLADCSACADQERGVRQVRAALAAPALYHRAPEALRDRLAGTRAAPAAPAPIPRPRRRRVWAMAATAAGVLILTVSSLSAGLYLARWQSAREELVEQVVDGHVRALQVAHATDVASSDRHTVKPWFLGKLDFAPQVPDLAAKGFPLVGGRLDYLDKRLVAALVYHRRDHVINVFTWPHAGGEGGRSERLMDRQGFHVQCWQDAGLEYWAISDLNAAELAEFVHLFRDSTASSR